jgi:hypothetical protein
MNNIDETNADCQVRGLIDSMYRKKKKKCKLGGEEVGEEVRM